MLGLIINIIDLVLHNAWTNIAAASHPLAVNGFCNSRQKILHLAPTVMKLNMLYKSHMDDSRAEKEKACKGHFTAGAIIIYCQRYIIDKRSHGTYSH